jgi:hypothetical protein
VGKPLYKELLPGSAGADDDFGAKESDGLATLASFDDNSNYGPSSTVAFIRRIVPGDAVLRDAESESDINQGAGKPNNASKSSETEVMMLPRRATADDFISCYWKFMHPTFPALHKPTFMEQYHQFWANEYGHGEHMPFKSDREHAIFVSLMNLLFALGCQFSDLVKDSQKVSVAYGFYERSRQSYNHDWLDSADLSLVQLLLINGVYLQSTRHSNRCWNSVGLAIRAAQILGLHVEPMNTVSSQLEREMRRRIWHTCVGLDR